MSHCVGHEQCPACADLGKDRSGNNLARYSDGSCFCFSCGYFKTANGLSKLKESKQTIERRVTLPYDVSTELPQRARDFLGKYHVTDRDIKHNHLMWSEHWQRLIFPYFNETGLLAWQGRYLGTENKSKWFSQGNLHEFVHIVGNYQQNTIVLTEDVISAIRVAELTSLCASPLFGSHISTKHMLRLIKFYGRIVVWLDKDKQVDAIKYSNQLQLLGVNSSVVITDKDPKDYTTEEIKQWLYKSLSFC